MEGITGYPFRNAHRQVYGGADRYYAPFLVPNQHYSLKKKELRDVDPENNRGLCLIPQILSNHPQQFCWAARLLKEMGYAEVNLNLGCPSATVVSRCRGAGMLKDSDRLDRFFTEVFSHLMKEDPANVPRISVKTRIGMTDTEEADTLIRIFNRYPIAELIIHPRLQEEFYQGSVHLDAFARMYEESTHPVCYNGVINTPEDMRRLKELLRDPQLVIRIREMDPAEEKPPLRWSVGKEQSQRFRTGDESAKQDAVDRTRLRTFLDLLYENYRAEMADDRQVLFRMKELWSYLKDAFPGQEKEVKKLKKAQNKASYETSLDRMFQTAETI